MSESALPPLSPRRSSGMAVLAAFLVGSLALHGTGFILLSRIKPRTAPAQPPPLELVVVDVQPPKPPPPPEEKKEPEAPKPKPRIVKPPPVKVAEASKPPPPKVEAPPPPNNTPPPPAAKPPPLVVGLTMSSTTTAGSFAAPVGNTAYGKVDSKARAPNEVQGYSAPKYVPVYQVDSLPILDTAIHPPYPEEAKHQEIEGQVTMSVTVDLEGRVVAAKVLSGPGHGLNEAALDAVKRARFKPARKGGEPVSTEIIYTYTFMLD